MRRVGVCLALGASAAATPALAQEDAKVKLQVRSGLSDDDDLLDPDLDGGSDTPAVPEPPLEEKTRIDNEAVEIGRDADRFGDELRELVRTLRQNKPGSRDEVVKRLADAKSQLSGLNAQVVELEKELEKKEGRKRTAQRGTYGTALDLQRLPGRSQRPQRGDEQFTWWQQLVSKTTNGIRGDLLELAGYRANALKARADKLTLGTARAHRAYVDVSVQESVGTSRFAQRIYDPRLDDLLLGKKRPTQVTGGPKKIKRRPEIDHVALAQGEPVVLLPRSRHPVTGRLVPVVNMALGGPFDGLQQQADSTPEPQPAQPPVLRDPAPPETSTSIKPVR